VLEGKKATVFPSEKGNLKAKGAEYVSQNVVEDGLIVTAVGPQAASEFGMKILEKLRN
jgi:putative intracellular protease/amidase